jgi:uncharacterized protein YjbI with pentapeptide repeats
VSQRVEVRVPAGNLVAPASPSTVFNDYIADIGLGGTLKRRHTIDIRAAQALAGAVPVFANSVRVSQYKFGSRPGSKLIEQLQVNPPNFPMFIRGTSPFIGDYIDVAAQQFVTDASGNWTFNNGTADQPVFHATWGDNRDVRPPANGDWTNFTPTVSQGDSPAGTQGGTSLFGDPSQPNRPMCAQGQSGVRNQNVYTAKITQGILVTSKGNSKQIGAFGRAYSIIVQNTTFQCKSFRLTLYPPNGTTASFLQLFSGVNPQLTLDVTIAPRSSIAREVFVKSSQPRPSIKVGTQELPTNGNCSPTNLSSLQPAANALAASYTFNADITNADIANADIANADIANADIATTELYIPALSNADITNADISNADITNADITNADISNADITNADIANATVANADITNADISNADITNADISNADISSATGDVTWAITNHGNTSSSFDTKLFLKGLPNKCVPQNCGTTGQPACTLGCTKFQLIVYKRYRTPVSSQNGGCTLMSQFQNQVITNVIDPTFLTTGSALTNADITNADISNATVALAPGEDAQVTVRVFGSSTTGGSSVNRPMRESMSFARIAESLAAAVAGTSSGGTAFTTVGNAQAVGSVDAANGITLPTATLTVTTTALPDAVTGQPYSTAVTAIGGLIGVKNLTWSLQSPLPTGLQLATESVAFPNRARGLISGSPAASAINGFNFTVQVVDAPDTTPPSQQSATQTLSIRIGDPLTIQPATIPDTILNTPLSFSFAYTGGLGAVTWTPVNMPAWLTLSAAGQLTGIPSASGTYSITVMATDSSCLLSITACQHQSVSGTFSLKVVPRKTTTQVTFSKNPIVVNETVSATATVSDIDTGATVTPAGTVTFGDGSTCTLAGSGATASCSVPQVFAAAGVTTISASYPGSSAHAPSSGSAALTVNTRSTSTTVTIDSTVVIVGQPATLTITVTDTQAEGTKATPSPAIALGSSIASDAIGGCTLVPGATAGISSCSVVFTPQTSGARTLTASFAANLVHSASTGSALLTVNPRPTTITLSLTPGVVTIGQPATASVIVTDTGAYTKFKPAGTIAFTSSIAGDVFGSCVLAPTAAAGVSTCSATVTPMSVGTRTISASFAQTPVHAASGPAAATLIAKYAITISVTASPNPSVPIQTLVAQFTAAYTAPVAPTGTVTIADSDGNSCTAPIAATGSCSFAPSSVGTKTLTASYPGDANFFTAQATATEVVQAYGFTGFLSPLNGTESYAGSSNLGNAVPIKWILTDASGAQFLALASAKQLRAVFTGGLVGGTCPVSSTGQSFVLYSPTLGATGGSTFRSSSPNGFIFNWDTTFVQSAGTGCYTIILDLADGTSKRTSLNLR